ncbi:hypothetical protein H6F93_24680 [Leptolyngbya sp. FACHB-671]|uniref:hypothetical protein n=1 Tax=Leptolyngbya sp. FACHB-671 TaxID=2692812 RepID=UPI00168A0574|nr:hypothetical protein [Leptolyngbya sp. FACHB-671]MBD2070670.1 hypothetical protein [Leptolyngbya sp. FACHB-671]
MFTTTLQLGPKLPANLTLDSFASVVAIANALDSQLLSDRTMFSVSPVSAVHCPLLIFWVFPIQVLLFQNFPDSAEFIHLRN